MNCAQLHWSIFVNIFNSVVLTFILRRSRIETQKGGDKMNEEEKDRLERQKRVEAYIRQSNIAITVASVAVSLNIVMMVIRGLIF